uniref:Uncharacterized protein n=1 Tax=Plectus sambesii TaxID=2011161 RepID=A0A914UPC2_9BILA
MAAQRVYGQGIDDYGGSENSDMFNFEQHRDTFISYFRRTNISFTSAEIDNLLQELKSIYDDMNNLPDVENMDMYYDVKSLSDEELSKFIDRLDNLSTSLQDRFPILASKLTKKEPISKAIIPLKANNFTDITDSNGYAKYRVLNGLYDYCAKTWFPYTTAEFPVPDWNHALPNIMNCRLRGGYNNWNDEIIGDLIRFTTYSRLINLARPNLNDIVLE